MSYIAYAWLTSITYGLGSVVGKIATRHHVNNPWLYNIIWWVVTVLCTLPFAIAGGVGLPQDWSSMVVLGISSALSGTLFVLAFYAVDLSILSPLSNLRTPLVALSGVLFLGERLGTGQWALIGIIFLAGTLINLDERMSIRYSLNKKTMLAFLWILSSVWFNSMIKYASQYNGFWEVSLWSNILGTFIVLPTIPLFWNDLKKTPLSRYHGLTLSTALFTAGFIFSVRALAENIGISIAIISLPLAMIMTMAISAYAPKLLEKHTAKIYIMRTVAAAVMFVAAMGLSL